MMVTGDVGEVSNPQSHVYDARYSSEVNTAMDAAATLAQMNHELKGTVRELERTVNDQRKELEGEVVS